MRERSCPVCACAAEALPDGLYRCRIHGTDVFMYCADCGGIMEGECQPCLNRAARAYIRADEIRPHGPWALR